MDIDAYKPLDSLILSKRSNLHLAPTGALYVIFIETLKVCGPILRPKLQELGLPNYLVILSKKQCEEGLDR